ncbi:MAG TPA: cytochrome b [Saliniramus sp.]|nr:cytochrome b [Saliniramus sp.]
MPAAPAHYSTLQIAIHWITAVIIIGMIPVGLTMTRLGPGTTTNLLYELHKSFGLIVIALAVIRIVVRLSTGVPPIVRTIPAWQRVAARATHFALYALIVLVPLFGWIATSTCCAPVNLFWTISVTLPFEGGMEASKPIFLVHRILAISLAAILLLHAGAALRHHYLIKDDTLRKMLPGGR